MYTMCNVQIHFKNGSAVAGVINLEDSFEELRTAQSFCYEMLYNLADDLNRVIYFIDKMVVINPDDVVFVSIEPIGTVD